MKELLLLLFTFSFIFYSNPANAQKEIKPFLAKNHEKVDLKNPEFQSFDADFYDHDIFFFGFMHGSATPQVLDYELLVHLHEHGVRYYAPEVGYSGAFFLNQYLETGNESFLDYVIDNGYRAPQDVSMEFKEKWQKIYRFNQKQKNEDKIQILGTDGGRPNIRHIAMLAPENTTGISVIDSLQYFKNPDKEKPNFSVYSGKHFFNNGKSWRDFFDEQPIASIRRQFFEMYEKDPQLILKNFGENAKELKYMMTLYEEAEGKRREPVIFENFKKMVIPKVQAGAKVYSNYGYFHVLQDKINGGKPIAHLLKEELNGFQVKVVSILGIMANSEVLDGQKMKKGKKFYAKGYKFHELDYSDYKNSKRWDGDGFMMHNVGVKTLKQLCKGQDVSLFKLIGPQSPFDQEMYFINFKTYRESLLRKGRWETTPGAVTTDYIQYLFFIQNSAPNTPFESEFWD